MSALKPLHVISLGAGVQSSTMALMAAHGEIMPMPDCAIFADTQAEPQSVYSWLDWLEKHLPFSVYRVTAGNLGAVEGLKVSKKGTKYARFFVPMYALTAKGKAMMLRQCTRDFKVVPIRRKVMSLLGKREIAIQWLGISFDELDRMKDSQHRRIVNRYPLVDIGMRRRNCLEWMETRGYPTPPRSACVFCPYHTDGEWQRLKSEEPEEFAKAAAYEKRQQELVSQSDRFTGVPFLHASLKPLESVTFVDGRQANLFRNECEGMCGV